MLKEIKKKREEKSSDFTVRYAKNMHTDSHLTCLKQNIIHTVKKHAYTPIHYSTSEINNLYSCI